MVQCNNPKCGHILKEPMKPKICPECGHVMMPTIEKKKKPEEKIEDGN